MNRIKFIEHYSDGSRIGDHSVLYALIRCLDIDDAVRLLATSISGNLLLRNASLKVVLEYCSDCWAEIYETFLEGIIASFAELPANRRGSAFYCMGELARYAPSQSRAAILEFLLSSRYAAGRRKGLAIINEDEIPVFKGRLERCAFEYRERKAALLMIQYFTPEYLFDRRTDFLSILDENWAVARLYLRAADYHAACLEELRDIDGITYAYAKAKSNSRLHEDEVMSLVEEYRHDERLGLLVWAIGKMKMWKILIHVADNYETWQTQRELAKRRTLEAKYGLG